MRAVAVAAGEPDPSSLRLLSLDIVFDVDWPGLQRAHDRLLCDF